MCGLMSGGIPFIISVVLAGTLAAPPPPPSPPPPSPPASPSSFDLLMPNVQPKEADTYLCNAVKVDEPHRYMTSFDAKADSHVAHHILLYGCEEPGLAPGKPWNCGEMSSPGEAPSDYPRRGVCAKGQTILYAWAMDAPKLTLPPGVGFEVGVETGVKYLVLQVHYKNVTRFLPPASKHDSSGLKVTTSPTRTPKQAGVYLLETGGHIPAKSVEYFEAACEYGDKELVPFAYRTHAHSLGRVISGYRVRDGVWAELGRRDPRDPEMFYNVTTPGLTIERGDILAARCTMENTQDHTVSIGNTQNDEMCNFYIMYYVQDPPLPTSDMCATPGPPYWYWNNFDNQEKLNLAGLPSSASVLPGTTTPLTRTPVPPLRKPQENPPYYDSIMDAFGEGLGGRTMEAGVGDPSRQRTPNAFHEQTDEELLDEAVNEMDAEELYYLVQELAREEQEEEAWRQMWQQRQRMRQNYVGM